MENDNLFTGILKIVNNPYMESVHEIENWSSSNSILKAMIPLELTAEELVACWGKSFPYGGRRYKLASIVDVKHGSLMGFIFPDEYTFDVKIDFTSDEKSLFKMSKRA